MFVEQTFPLHTIFTHFLSVTISCLYIRGIKFTIEVRILLIPFYYKYSFKIITLITVLTTLASTVI